MPLRHQFTYLALAGLLGWGATAAMAQETDVRVNTDPVTPDVTVKTDQDASVTVDTDIDDDVDVADADDDDVSERSGLYLSITGGYTFPDDDVEVSVDDTDTPFNVELDEGFSGTIATGMFIGGFRAELEGGYRQNDFDDEADIDAVSADGDIQMFTGMVNLYFDFPIADWLQGYVGVGGGVAYVMVDADADVAIFDADIEEEEWALAYQGMAGLAWRLNDDLWLLTGYRAFTTEDVEFDDFEFEMPWLHTAEIGLRFEF